MNDLGISIFAGISTTRRTDIGGILSQARVTSFTTQFNRGLYGVLRVFVPGAVRYQVWWLGGDRIVIRSGIKVVFEGEIIDTGYVINERQEGLEIAAVGLYGGLLGRQTWDKRWADNRLSDDIWRTNTTDFRDDLYNEDRRARIRITPKKEPHKASDGYGVTYTMPTGETVKRITNDYDFKENGYVNLNYAKHNDDPAGSPTFTDMTNALDNDTSTHHDLTLTSDDYIYMGHKDITAWALIRVDMGTTVNAVASVLSCEYYQAADETNPAQWTSLSISDGTASGGATLAQDGNITFTQPDDWQRTTIDSDSAYWLRFQVSVNLTASIDIKELYIGDIQTWALRMRDTVGAANVWSVTSEASGSQDVTLGTARQVIELQFLSNTEQVPRQDGSYLGEMSNVMVYSETGTITAGAIANDILGEVSNLNSYSTLITDPGLTLEPFYTDGPESMASILERAVAYGDASFNSYYVQLVSSERSTSPNGKPVLLVAQYPALTDYDLIISVGEDNLVGNIQFTRDYGSIVNWVSVQYRDDENNRDIVVTPDDDSNLKDATSITKYGERHIQRPLNVGVATLTMAKNIARRFLARNKDPKFFVSGPITIIGGIRKKSGDILPASEIYSGLRLKITDYLDDLTGTSGAGLTQIITDTAYTEDDNGEYCSINLEGLPDNLSIILAQRELIPAQREAAF